MIYRKSLAHKIGLTDIEVRRMYVFKKFDDSSQEQGSHQFMGADGIYTKNSQTALGIAAIYKFQTINPNGISGYFSSFSFL